MKLEGAILDLEHLLRGFGSKPLRLSSRRLRRHMMYVFSLNRFASPNGVTFVMFFNQTTDSISTATSKTDPRYVRGINFL